MNKLAKLVIELYPSFIKTPAIRAKEAKFTPSSILEKALEFLNLFIQGLINQTNKNEGKKIPTVAAIAPENPFIK